jgi:hypothetical protein
VESSGQEGLHGLAKERSGRVPCLPCRVPCLRGTAVNTAILLRFPSISGRNRPTIAPFSVQPSWETCTAGRARRDAQMCVTREEIRCGRTLPCELARISLRDTARVVGPAGSGGAQQAAKEVLPAKRTLEAS